MRRKNKLTNIYVRLKEGRSVDMTAKTRKFIHPENWNPNSQTVKPKADITDKDDFNLELKTIRRYIEDEFLLVPDKSNPGKDCNLATNTVGKQIAVLKGFMSAAFDRGLTTNSDFRKRNFKIVTEESEAIYLNEEELDKLWKKIFPIKNTWKGLEIIF